MLLNRTKSCVFTAIINTLLIFLTKHKNIKRVEIRPVIAKKMSVIPIGHK